MKTLYRFRWDIRRGGRIEGVFVADDSVIEAALGKRVYLGEVLGKNSEVQGTLDKEDLSVITTDQNFIEEFLHYGCQSGYNPLSYLNENE